MYIFLFQDQSKQSQEYSHDAELHQEPLEERCVSQINGFKDYI